MNDRILEIQQVGKLGKLSKKTTDRYQQEYREAMTGKSRKKAISSFCKECVGWYKPEQSVRDCTDTGCPLWNYRPHQNKNDIDNINFEEAV